MSKLYLIPLLLLIFPLLAQGPLPWLWVSQDGKTSGWKSSTILGQIPIVGVSCTSSSESLGIQLMVQLPNNTCLPIIAVTPTGLMRGVDIVSSPSLSPLTSPPNLYFATYHISPFVYSAMVTTDTPNSFDSPLGMSPHLVFRGTLQRLNTDYIITGPKIVFTNPLVVGETIQIVYF